MSHKLSMDSVESQGTAVQSLQSTTSSTLSAPMIPDSIISNIARESKVLAAAPAAHQADEKEASERDSPLPYRDQEARRKSGWFSGKRGLTFSGGLGSARLSGEDD